MLKILSIVTLVLLFENCNYLKAQDTIMTAFDGEFTRMDIRLLGRVQSAKVIRCENSDNSMTYYFDRLGHPTKIIEINNALFTEGTSEKVFEFKDGLLVNEIYFENGETFMGTVYKYDKGGRLTKRFNFSNYKGLGKKAGKLKIQEAFKYNKKGYKVAHKQYISERVAAIDRFKYDPNGNLISEGRNKLFMYKPLIAYDYNSENQKIKEYSIGDWKPSNWQIFFQYDENGNLIDVKGYSSMAYNHRYQYNEYGKMTKKVAIAGNLSIDGEEYKTLETKYDDYQNLVEEKYYDWVGNLGKVIKYIYIYDSNCNWIRCEKLKGKNNNNLQSIEVTERVLNYY